MARADGCLLMRGGRRADLSPPKRSNRLLGVGAIRHKTRAQCSALAQNGSPPKANHAGSVYGWGVNQGEVRWRPELCCLW